MQSILVVNAGSSSVKFQVFDISERNKPTRLIKGQVDGIGSRPRIRADTAGKKPLIDETFDREKVPDIASALQTAGKWLRESQKVELSAVGHRVVHGGPQYDRPIRVDTKVLADLTRYEPLAPLHQPNNLAPIRALLKSSPSLTQVACFDTAFHRGHDQLADHYAIPADLYAEGVRRYGFHGLSYEYIADRLPQIAPSVADGRVIVAHLGSGASMCGLKQLRSCESTMGFTALDGLPMGTRPGQLDPGVILYLIEQKKMTAGQVQDLLYKDCGLKALSGISNDVRELQGSSDPRAKFALDYFVYRIVLQTGLLAAALGGLDAFVFTAGIGENSASIRKAVVEKLEWMGASIDAAANEAGRTVISSPSSRIAIYVIPTDEELMIARHTLATLNGSSEAAAS